MEETEASRQHAYLWVEERMSREDIPLDPVRLAAIVDLLTKDMERPQHMHKVLPIFRRIFTNKQAQAYLSSMTGVIVSIMKQLIAMSKSDQRQICDPKNVEMCLLILKDLPASLYKGPQVDIQFLLHELITIYFTESGLTNYDLMLQFIKRYMEARKDEFIMSGYDKWFLHMMTFILKDSNVNRDFGLDVADLIVSDLVKSPSYMNRPQWHSFLTNVKNKDLYPKLLLNLLLASDPSWSRAWITTIKILGTTLHKIGYSINPLLYVVQESFKMTQSRIDAFRCLHTLMDNFAMDNAVLYHKQRIKVIMSALEINNAKVETVALIKFDVWWHYITLMLPRMADHYVMVLMPFLKFCFGSTKASIGPPSTKPYPGEVFSSVQRLALVAFSEMCGHFQCTGCAEKFGNNLKRLASPILTCAMLGESRTDFVYALGRATVLHLRTKTEENEDKNFNQTISCIWKSFLRIASQCEKDVSYDILMKTLVVLSDLIGIFFHQPSSAKTILTMIIPTIFDSSGYSETVLIEYNPKLMCSPLLFLITLILRSNSYGQLVMSDVQVLFEKMFTIGMKKDPDVFCSWLVSRLKFTDYCSIMWCILAKVSLQFDTITFSTTLKTLRCPIVKLGSSPEKMLDVCASWKELYQHHKSKEMDSSLIKTFKAKEKDSLIKPFYGNMICSIILNLLADPTENLDEVNDLLKITETCMINTTDEALSPIKLLSLTGLLDDFLAILLMCQTNKIVNILLEPLYCAVNRLLKHIFMCFELKLKQDNSTEEIIKKLVRSLEDCLTRPYCQKIINNVVDLLIKICNVSDFEIQQSCQRIFLHCALLNDVSGALDQYTSFKLRQHLNTFTKKHTPAKNSSVDHIRTEKAIPITNVKDSSKFVIIKPAWKFDPKKLTEHQKEAIKRRRDDIPALYEDLTQSQDEHSMQAWKPPGYTSDSQSNSNSDTHTLTKTFQDEPDKSAFKQNSINVTKNVNASQMLRLNDRTKHMMNLCLSNGDESLNISDNKSKKCRDKENNSESENVKDKKGNKTDVECESFDGNRCSKLKKKSILSRLNDSLKSLTDVSPVKIADTFENLPKQQQNDSLAINEECKENISTADPEISVIAETQNEGMNSKSTLTRPARIKRKPNKLIDSEEKNNAKNSKRNKQAEDSEKTCVENTNEGIKDISEFKQSMEEIVKKRKSRLLSQLSIDTNEGHPMITPDIINKVSRIRRSSVASVEQKNMPLNKSDTSEKSIFSQDTEVIKIDSPECLERTETFIDNNSESSDCSDKPESQAMKLQDADISMSESFDSPDCIESSQEDTLSVKLRSGSITSEAIENNSSSSVVNHMDSQQIADADTEPVAVEIATNEINSNSENNTSSESIQSDDVVLNISIVSSPCKEDLKERTLEFLNSTVGISPIKGVSSMSDLSPKGKTSPDKADTNEACIPKEMSKISVSLSVKLSDPATSPDPFAAEKNSPTKQMDVDNSKPSAEVSPNKSSIKAWSAMMNAGSRTAQMLSLCLPEKEENHVEIINCEAVESKKDKPLDHTYSTFDENKMDTNLKMQPLLEFNKIVPCPSASPIGPILKRKMELDEPSPHPSPKKKRVSFHDPPVSTMVNVEKYISPRVYRSPQVKVVLTNCVPKSSSPKANRSVAAKCLMKKMEMQVVDLQSKEPPDSQLSDICSLDAYSPQPLNVITNYLLEDKHPIFPSLVDCEDSLAEISSKLSSPLWKDEFMKEIEDIKTIGALARLTELDVSRLPFKTPKIETVKKALEDYEKSKCAKVENREKDTIVDNSVINKEFNETVSPINDDKTEIELSNMEIVSKSSTDQMHSFTEQVLSTCPEDLMKIVNDKLSHSVILDSIPADSLIQYIARKVCDDEEFKGEISKLVSDKSDQKSINRELVNAEISKINKTFGDMMESIKRLTEDL